MIKGVVLKELVTHSDERGFFREIIRSTDDFFKDGFGQFSHSTVYTGVVKAWHFHKIQTQWTYVATGLLDVVLNDTRKDSDTFRETMNFLIGDHIPQFVYCFPPGVAHGYRCINGPAQVFYITSGQYDLNDEARVPHDDPDIGYDWAAWPRIK